MTRIRRAALLSSGLMLAVVLTACGSSSSGGGTAPPAGSGSSSSPSGASADTIQIKNFSFQPSSLTVSPGTKVTFVMDDSGTMHTATGSGNSAFINSPKLTKGQSYTVTFTKPGTYNYICSIHPYMNGSVVVK